MPNTLTYKDAGVDIDAGNNLVDQIKAAAKSTHRPEVLGNLGGFAGCFAPNLKDMTQPILVSSTDGVGTKLCLAIQHNNYNGIGIDLVAMCANDLVVMGAEPLFFLDYYATSKLEPQVAQKVIESIANGCKQAGMALLGGETAEMPGLYQNKDFDLAGFCVGIVDKPKLITGDKISPGDKLIALASSGVHANGFSLVRKVLELHASPENTAALLAPTKIYVKTVLELAQTGILKGAAHITGGGLSENIPRVLPANCQAQLIKNSWDMPDIFVWLQQHTNLSFLEFQRVFNCGVGMVLCVAPEDVNTTLQIAQQNNETAWEIGSIQSCKPHDTQVQFI